MSTEAVGVAAVVDFLAPRIVRSRIDDADTELLGPTPVTKADASGVAFLTRASAVAELDPSTRPAMLISSQAAFGLLTGVANEVAVADPRLEFARVCQRFFARRDSAGIAGTATVDSSASIGRDVRVEAGAVIGPGVTIGDRSRVGANVVIAANSHLGEDVVVGPGTVIGHTGFGYARDHDGTPVPLPHIAGVRIGDRVEIGANTTIDRGTLADTVIDNDAKIDNLVHVAHNCHIGAGAFVIASSVLCGSVRVGPRAWIAPNASVREHLEIGADALVGLAATVVKDVANGTTVVGSPAEVVRNRRATVDASKGD